MSGKEKLPKEALEFFRKKGRMGGHARAVNLTPKQRSEQARNAVQARWAQQAMKKGKERGTE
jgi:hypothetical protein